MFSKTRVAVLRGGPSSEYHVSLKTGATVLTNLPEQYHPLDVFIDVSGVWHLHGRPQEPQRILHTVDAVFNALHGEYGEDGAVQELLEAHHVPFTGPGRLAAALSQNKVLAKRVLEPHGIKTPYFRVLERDATSPLETLAAELYRSFPQPCVIKPANRGSSIGVSTAQAPDEIAAALTAGFAVSELVLVEEYIRGREAVCGVIEGFRGVAHYPLLPVEVRLPNGKHTLDFDTRYGSHDVYQFPGQFSAEEKRELQNLAVSVHRLLGLRQYSSTDFILSPRRGLYFIETDALPSLVPESPFPAALREVGGTLPHFLEHLVELALRRT